jgi:predicted esterase
LAAAVDPTDAFVHVAPEGPIDLGGGDFAWFDDEPGSLAACRHVVRALFDGLAADGGGGRMVVIGYSQGAAAAVAALTDPGAGPIDGIVGLAVLSGFVAESAGVEQDLGCLAGVPVLVQHGRDDDVVPQFFAEDLATALVAAGAQVTTDWRAMAHERTADSVRFVGEWARPLAGVEV